MLLGGIGLLILTASARAGSAVTVVSIDGSKVQGVWFGLSEGKVHVQQDSARRSFELEDLMLLDFSASTGRGFFGKESEKIAAEAFAAVHLADGGSLHGQLLPSDGERVTVQTGLTGKLQLPLDQLAGVRVASPEAFPTSRELFDEALASRLPGQDIMVTRGLDDVKALRGRLVRLGPDGGSFVFGDRERTFQPHRLYGIVFAAGVARGDSLPFFVALSDGTSFSAVPLNADQKQITLRSAGGAEITVPLAEVSRIDVRSRRLVYVSDMTPADERSEGRLHRPSPPRRDRSMVGGPIRMNGVAYPKGIAMTSRSEVTYDLNGAYLTFAATVGIDDAVRPYGLVNLIVMGDDKTLLETGSLSGMDEPREISISVQGVQKLTLITDYGDDLDLSDHADWALARLLKKSVSGGPSPTEKPEK